MHPEDDDPQPGDLWLRIGQGGLTPPRGLMRMTKEIPIHHRTCYHLYHFKSFHRIKILQSKIPTIAQATVMWGTTTHPWHSYMMPMWHPLPPSDAPGELHHHLKFLPNITRGHLTTITMQWPSICHTCLPGPAKQRSWCPWRHASPTPSQAS